MARSALARKGSATRDRILNAAILRFARSSYESVGLRDIAADAGVDVAYVHRCFGSKERLFAESLEATMEPAKLFAGPPGDIADFLAKQIFARDGGRGRNTVGPLDIIIRSLSSVEASGVLRELATSLPILLRNLQSRNSTSPKLRRSCGKSRHLGTFGCLPGVQLQ